MTRFFKATFLSVLACSALTFLACGDDPSAPHSTDERETHEKKDSVTVYNAFTDPRDGNVYRVVQMGSQAWMAEDLRYMDTKAMPMLKKHSWCATSKERCKKNGYLYDFAAAINDSTCIGQFCEIEYPRRGICPEGWHLPSKSEWSELLFTADELDIAIDEYSLFASNPTGEYNFNLDVAEEDDCARYWTSSQENSSSAYEFYRCRDRGFQWQDYQKNFGYAVRCVADSIPRVDTYVEYEIPERKSSSSSKKVESSSSSEQGSDPEESSSSVKSSSSSEVSSCSSWESYVKDTTLNAFTDKRDGNVYRVYQIGTQVWMAENLRYADSVASPALVGHHWEWDTYLHEYLYSFGAVMGDVDCETTLCSVTYPHRGICPEGWHVPESSEWHTLVETARSLDESLFDNRGFDAGWNFEYDATNRAVGEEGPDHRYARFWSASQNNASGADEWYGDFNGGTVLKVQGYSKKFGYALRCVADSGEVKLDKHKDHLMSSSSVQESSSSSEPVPMSSCDYRCDSSSSSSVPMSSCDYRCDSSSSSSVPMSSCDLTCNSSSSSSPVTVDLESFVDARDGNEYRAVQIDDLAWMKDNLRYMDSVATPALVGNKACIETDNGIKCDLGVLYTYSAAVGNSECATTTCFESYGAVQGICPDGWRLPTKSEWESVRSKATRSWDVATILDFIPTGERKADGTVRYDMYARIWLADESGSLSAYEGYNSIGSYKMEVQVYQKAFGYAVRCVKNLKITDN